MLTKRAFIYFVGYMRHNLKIEVQDIYLDTRYIKVTDWSVYNPQLALTNRVLKMLVPGREMPVITTLPASDSLIYNSKILKLSKVVEDLPDGLWEVTYSICPNEKLFDKVYHFRTAVLNNRLHGTLAKYFNCRQTLYEKDFVQALLMLKALRANTIDNYNSIKAYELYSDIERTLNNIDTKLEQ